VGYPVTFDGDENVIDLAARFGTIINCMLGPFVEFEVDGLNDLKTAHTGKCLNQVTGVAMSHVTPLVFYFRML
jgi:hypothetical protein